MRRKGSNYRRSEPIYSAKTSRILTPATAVNGVSGRWDVTTTSAPHARSLGIMSCRNQYLGHANAMGYKT